MASPPDASRFPRSRRVAGKPLRSGPIRVKPSTRQSPPIKPTFARFLIVWGILVGAAALLSLNLVRLQVLQASALQAQARQQQMIYLRPFIPRRPVVDRQGNTLAIDRPVYTLFAHPILFKQSKSAVAEQLAPILGKPVADVLKKFDSAESGIRLEYALAEGAADRIKRLMLDGLDLTQQQQRLYPQRDLTAEVLGYVDVDQQAQAGVEYTFKDILERSTKAVRLSRTGLGEMLPDHLPMGFLHVDNLQVQLTLDRRIQQAARKALHKQIEAFSAKRGIVMVMDATDGAMLALASDPSYDPNEYYKSKVENFKNWALTDLYEPGSTFKPINVAIALESGAIKADQYFYDEGQIYVDGWPINNSDGAARGSLSVTEILKYSSNIGMVHIIQQMKPKEYYKWLQRVGLNQPTGMDLPFEMASQLKDQKTFLSSPIEPATSAFGQGFSLTPIKLCQLVGALANGGKLVTPHVVKGLYETDGQPYWQPDRPTPKQVFSPKNTQAILNMMEVVVADGTGKNAQVPGYRIAGKTGTAQKAGSGGGGYGNARITSFISVFPVEAPRYVVIAIIDEPQGANAYGGTVAAPIVKEVIESVIGIEKIPPSEPKP